MASATRRSRWYLRLGLQPLPFVPSLFVCMSCRPHDSLAIWLGTIRISGQVCLRRDIPPGPRFHAERPQTRCVQWQQTSRLSGSTFEALVLLTASHIISQLFPFKHKSKPTMLSRLLDERQS